MRIRWRGHASFIIETVEKTLITDPFNEQLGYPLHPVTADLVTVSHEHWDHNAVETITGEPRIKKDAAEEDFGWVNVKGIASWHDRHQGKERGLNTIFKFCADGIAVVHLGDLGHILSEPQAQAIGSVDILLLPVGGIFTIDAGEAAEVVKLLNPRIVIPMHFKTPHLSFNLAPVEDFLSRYDRVIKKPCLEVDLDSLGTEMRIIVLDYLYG